MDQPIRLYMTLICSLFAVLLMSCATTPPLSPEQAQCAQRPGRFSTGESGTVLDRCTQLVWMTEDYRNIEGQAPSGYQVAVSWVDTINQQRYGGFTDWRIPTMAEYRGLYTPAQPRQSYTGQPVGYPETFADGGGKWYWSSEVSRYGSGHIHDVYIFNFHTGKESSRYIYPHFWRGEKPNEGTGSVRLVRGSNQG